MSNDIKKLQTMLNEEGFGPLVVDGRAGPKTDLAYQAWQLVNLKREMPRPAPEKPWWQSKAIWGAVSTVIVSVGGLFIQTDVSAEQLSSVIMACITAITGIIGLYGTITRKAPIDPDLILPNVRASQLRKRRELSSSADEATGDSFPEGPFWDS